MLYQRSPLFERLHEQVSVLPVIDCHEHWAGPEGRPPYREPIASLLDGYVMCDLHSAAFGIDAADVERLVDHDVPTDEKWPLFERLWRASRHTAYARVTRLVLENVYGEREMTREALDRVAEKLGEQTEEAYFRTIEEAGIQAVLTDALAQWAKPGRLEAFVAGKKRFPPAFRPLVPLPDLHPPTMTWEVIDRVARLADRHLTSLDEYLEAVHDVLRRCVERGAVGVKDQSAYTRIVSYDVVTRADAERLFNRVLNDPRNSLGWPESKPLNDFLFHQYMRFARDLDLPVQLHTGHMAGIYNRVDKTNAAHLASTLELHQDVRFDLFHGNWPYLGDLLFLGKNYPNVSLDCCWLHIIDPRYAAELLERSIFTMPHTKIHGYGGDCGDIPEFSTGHLQIAREVIAGTLARLVERGWLEEEEAVSLAADWLFNNPNRFFELGLEEI